MRRHARSYAQRFYHNLSTYYCDDASRCWYCDQDNEPQGHDVQVTVLRCPDTGNFVTQRPMCQAHREHFHANGYAVYTVAY